MVRTLVRTAAALVLAAVCTGIVPAYADTADAIANNIVEQANIGLKNAMNARKAPGGVVAQVPPVTQQPVGTQQGLPTGFTYTFDFSVAKPFGNIGNKTNWLPGGVDAVAAYGFNPTTRVVASYYELQHYPVGFNSGTVPIFLQGLPNPIGCVDLSGGTANGCSPISNPIDVTTKDRFILLNFEKLFFIGRGKMQIPIVVTPTYVARTATIAASPTNDDRVAFQYNGKPVFGVRTRTSQVQALAVTLPFLKTPKMFGTFTIAPSWLVHTAGVNQENKAQLYQILYVEYNLNPNTKFFLEPQSSRDYLPADTYAQHLNAYFLGASQRVGRYGFVQLVLNSGSPSNYSPYGVSALTCLQAGNCAATTVPTVGGLKATQLQIQFGVGSPSVLPF
ncbi:MAG: hypothetical protein JO165_02290 [Candidatus Eremiobacteraeota bacterium]|nr:hypothetical protein [Candidatus Eremiobacteraeota bacterium]